MNATQRLNNPAQRAKAKAKTEIRSFEQAEAYLNGKDERPAPKGTSTTIVRFSAAAIAVRYHRTNVVTYYADGTIELNTGGWRTMTTKRRINDYIPLRWTVYQKDYNWYLSGGGKKVQWTMPIVRIHTLSEIVT